MFFICVFYVLVVTCVAVVLVNTAVCYSRIPQSSILNWLSVKDMREVITPVITPRTKDPLKTTRNTPIDFSMALPSNVWLLSPAGWYATIDLWGNGKT